MIAATVTGLAATGILIMFGGADASAYAGVALLSGWSAFCLVHALVCWLAYRGCVGDELRDRLLSDPGNAANQTTSRRIARLLIAGGGVHSFAVSAATMALIGVMVLVIYPNLRRESELLILGAVLVISAWLDTATAYAVHYAFVDSVKGGLTFPGRESRAFSDYQYFSSGIQATLGTTDVTVETRSMRTTVRHHSLLAFTFNSVIVAILVSLVLTLA